MRNLFFLFYILSFIFFFTFVSLESKILHSKFEKNKLFGYLSEKGKEPGNFIKFLKIFLDIHKLINYSDIHVTLNITINLDLVKLNYRNLTVATKLHTVNLYIHLPFLFYPYYSLWQPPKSISSHTKLK